MYRRLGERIPLGHRSHGLSPGKPINHQRPLCSSFTSSSTSLRPPWLPFRKHVFIQVSIPYKSLTVKSFEANNEFVKPFETTNKFGFETEPRISSSEEARTSALLDSRTLGEHNGGSRGDAFD